MSADSPLSPSGAAGGAATVAQLEQRLASLPGTLRAALSTLASSGLAPLADAEGPVLVTGGGMSEGPARYLVALLAAAGRAAAYVPLSEFVAPSVPLAGGTLVLFSQGLAPNARYPLLHLGQFRRTLVVTAVAPSPTSAKDGEAKGVSGIAARAQAQGATIVTLPPAEEDGLLLRIVGPAVHALCAAYLAGVPHEQLASVPAVYEAPADAATDSLLHKGELLPIALVASGRYADACFGLRWKLLEGLHVPDPPIWDILQVVHGPFQSLWHHAQTLVVLGRDDAPHEAPLTARLDAVLAKPRHRVLRLPATRLAGLLAYFEHDAQLNRLVLRAIAERGVDLVSWPGRGYDGPLYLLAPDGV